MKVFLKILLTLVIIAVLTAAGANLYIVLSEKENIKSVDECKDMEDIDCIIILGAGVIGDRPSDMLKDRLDTGIALYKNKAAPKIIMTGDHGTTEYDEVNVMKKYAIDNGVPSEDVFMDHAGFSTYESIYRARSVFGAKNVIIVSQKYHLYRSLHIADSLKVNAVGVSADLRSYNKELLNESREFLARTKDFFKCIFKPLPKYLGDPIPVSGSGDVTNDK